MKLVCEIAGILFCVAGFIAVLKHSDWWCAYICVGLMFTTLGNFTKG